ncbi:DUF4113 domain-containing protein [Pseudomonas sp. CFBP 13719]
MGSWHCEVGQCAGRSGMEMRREMMSQSFTTRIDQLWTVQAK